MISKAAAKQQLQAAEPVSPGDVRSSATTHTVSYNPYRENLSRIGMAINARLMPGG